MTVSVIETVAWGDTPIRPPQTSEAVLYLKTGEPYVLGFGCPCGRGPTEGWAGLHMIRFAEHGGPHTLVSVTPLTVSPSIGNKRPCVQGEGCCHFFIHGGEVEWSSPIPA